MTQNKVKAKAPKLNICKDVSGSILPLSAIALIALAGMVGGGVDMSRSYMVQNRLQNACDSGVLAGRRAVDTAGFTSAAKGRAEDFFDTNFDEENEGVSETTFVASSPDNGNTVNGAASTSVDTVVMRLFGFDEIALNVNCTASMSVGNSDVMMVLDTTGSMGWDLDGSQTRIQALRKAMKDFYTTVEASADGTNARIRYGFVPYSSTVNVGSLILNQDASYLADSHEYQSKKALFEEVEVDTFAGWEDPYTQTQEGVFTYDYDWWDYHTGSYLNRNSCNNARPSNSNWVNSGGTTTTTNAAYVNNDGQRITAEVTSQDQTQTQYACYRRGRRDFWVIRREATRTQSDTVYSIEDPIYTTTTTTEFAGWSYEKVNYDTSTYKTFASVSTPTGADGSSEISTWDGCIEERQTVPNATFSFSSILGLDPSGARDLDIDGSPTGNKATKWKPAWPQISYRRTDQYTNPVAAAQSDYGLPTPPNDFYVCPKQAQTFQTLNKGEFDSYADALTPAGATYHNIGMIWGTRLSSPEGVFEANVNEAPANGGNVARHIIFMSDGAMQPNVDAYSAYGVERHDQRVTDDGSSDHSSRHTQRFIAACDIAKSKGIRVWVIAFATGLTPDLEDCASDDSSFTAASADQLNEAFQEIAKDVGELRITQ